MQPGPRTVPPTAAGVCGESGDAEAELAPAGRPQQLRDPAAAPNPTVLCVYAKEPDVSGVRATLGVLVEPMAATLGGRSSRGRQAFWGQNLRLPHVTEVIGPQIAVTERSPGQNTNPKPKQKTRKPRNRQVTSSHEGHTSSDVSVLGVRCGHGRRSMHGLGPRDLGMWPVSVWDPTLCF